MNEFFRAHAPRKGRPRPSGPAIPEPPSYRAASVDRTRGNTMSWAKSGALAAGRARNGRMRCEAFGPALSFLLRPIRHRRIGCIAARRRRARFHRGRRAGRQGVQILSRRSVEKGTGGALLLSQVLHERLHGRGA